MTDAVVSKLFMILRHTRPVRVVPLGSHSGAVLSTSCRWSAVGPLLGVPWQFEIPLDGRRFPGLISLARASPASVWQNPRGMAHVGSPAASGRGRVGGNPLVRSCGEVEAVSPGLGTVEGMFRRFNSLPCSHAATLLAARRDRESTGDTHGEHA
jgi:hypothetical protein